MSAEWLTRMDVRHVQLHDRHCQHRERIAQTVTVVSPGARVDQNGIYVFAEALLDPFAHCAFVVGLKASNLATEFLAECQQPRVNLRQRGPAVLGGLALAEHVEVDAVENEDLHGASRLCQSTTACHEPSRAAAKIV